MLLGPVKRKCVCLQLQMQLQMQMQMQMQHRSANNNVKEYINLFDYISLRVRPILDE
jgi:hypothetical protein